MELFNHSSARSFEDVLSMKVIIGKQIVFYYISLVSNYCVLASEGFTALPCRKELSGCFPPESAGVLSPAAKY